MQKIKKVILENFQSHKSTILDFNENLNIIVGETDSGKTAIFRALKWALYNEPQGDYFMREGSSNVSVSVEFTSGHIIKRSRNKSKNRYEITYPNGEVEVFEGFSNTVPKEVLEVTKMPKLSIGGRENRAINLSEQLDPPFLLAESLSLKALAIGKLVEADVVDNALSSVNIDLKNANRDRSNILEEINILGENLKEYDYLEKLEEDIKNLEKLNIKIKALYEKLEKLENLNNLYRSVDKEIRNREIILKNLDFISSLELLKSNLDLKIRDLNQLAYYKESLRSVNENKKEKLEKLGNLKHLTTYEDITSKLNQKMSSLNNLVYLKKEKLSYESRIKKGEEVVSRLKFLDYSDIDNKISVESVYKLNRLNELNLEYKNTKKRIETGEKYISNFTNIDKITDCIDEISLKTNKLKNLENYNNSYKHLEYNIKSLKKDLDNHINSIDKYENSYIDTMKELRICPTCSHRLEEHDYETLKNHLGS